MEEAAVKFERENQDGIVAVGTYLIDAARRFGIRLEGDCVQSENIHFCSVNISEGVENLSSPTRTEKELFASGGRRTNDRLMCHAKIEKPGEIVVMTEEPKKDTTEETADNKTGEQYRKEFEELPLEKKIASLVRLEAITLSDTFSFVVNSPLKVVDKFLDVMAEFGLKKEANAKDAVRPEEHKTKTAGAANPGHAKKAPPRKKTSKPAEGN